jgi:hypothetical protein
VRPFSFMRIIGQPVIQDLGEVGSLIEPWEYQSENAKTSNRVTVPAGFCTRCTSHIIARPNIRQGRIYIQHSVRAIGWYMLAHDPMARHYARWRIHRKSPSWLRPRQEVAHPLLSLLNLKLLKACVKPSGEFLSEIPLTAKSLIYWAFSAR